MLLAAFAPPSAFADPPASGTIFTLAGAGPPDNASADSVSLRVPTAVTLDDSGDLLIANDTRAFKVSGGAISTIAGSKTAGYFGDGGPASSAAFDVILGMATHGSDTYFVDADNYCIRKKDATDDITTYLGPDDGLINPVAIAVADDGTLYIADGVYFYDYPSPTAILKMPPGGPLSAYIGPTGSGATIETDSLGYPGGLALDASGSLYISDQQYGAVWKATTDGSFSAYLGPTGSGATYVTDLMVDPIGLAVHGSDLYVAEAWNGAILKPDAAPPGVTVVAGASDGSYGYDGDGGPATSALLNFPVGVATDGSSLYIADAYNFVVRKVDLTEATPTISTVAGNGFESDSDGGGVAAISQLNQPDAIVPYGNFLYILDTGNSSIWKMDLSRDPQTIVRIAGDGYDGFAGDGGPASSAELNQPEGLTVDPRNGDLYVADTGNDRIRKIDAGTQEIATVAGGGVPAPEATPPDDAYAGDGGPAADALLYQPIGIAIDSHGDLFIADSGNNVIREVSGGIISTYAGRTEKAYDGDGHSVTAEGATIAAFNVPYGLAIDAQDNLYIADFGNNVVRRIDAATGTLSTVAGGGSPDDYLGDEGGAVSAELFEPFGLALDSQGNLYITEQDYGGSPDTGRVRKVSLNGFGVLSDNLDLTDPSIITTVAGGGCGCSLGDDGPATDAALDDPGGVAAASGNLYIADTGHNLIREVYQPDVTPPDVAIGLESGFPGMTACDPGDPFDPCDEENAGANLGQGNSFIVIEAQDAGSGFGGFYVDTDYVEGNFWQPFIQENTGPEADGWTYNFGPLTTNKVRMVVVKNDPNQPSTFTFKVKDNAGNVGHPDLNFSSVSPVNGSSLMSRTYRSVSKDQGRFSILSKTGSLRNAQLNVNGEIVPLGNVPAGEARAVDLRSRLRNGSDNAITLTAQAEAGTQAWTLVSSATLMSMDPQTGWGKIRPRGDMNLDGRLDVTDAIALLRSLAGLNPLSASLKTIGDVNLDGKTNVADVTLLLKRTVKK
jgi:sugar lactone lactonase YvrE